MLFVDMTGTPILNSYTDLYSILHILYNDEYNEFFGFPIQMSKKPNEQEREIINEKIQPFCRTTKQRLSMPQVNPDKLVLIKTTKVGHKLFEIITAKYRKDKLALFIRLLQLESNPKMILLSLKLSEFRDRLNITDYIDNIDYVDYSEDVKKLIYSIKITSKMNICIN